MQTENAAHFCLKRFKGFVSEAVGDMQKIRMGIALCHFALAAKESGINVCFSTDGPGVAAEADTDIASYLLTR